MVLENYEGGLGVEKDYKTSAESYAKSIADSNTSSTTKAALKRMKATAIELANRGF